MDVDDVMNRQLNYFSHKFRYSYSRWQCATTVQNVFCLMRGNCHVRFHGNPPRMTKLFGEKINITGISIEEYFNRIQDLQLQCPRECTVLSYDVKHSFSTSVLPDSR